MKICNNCSFYESVSDQNGICRHTIPSCSLRAVAESEDEIEPFSFWPPVFYTDWCGEWKPKDENENIEKDTSDNC